MHIHPTLKSASDPSICFFKHNYFYAGGIDIMRDLSETVLTHPSSEHGLYPDNYSDWTAKHEENVLHSLKQEQNYVVAELINGLQVLDNQKNRQIAKGITKMFKIRTVREVLTRKAPETEALGILPSHWWLHLSYHYQFAFKESWRNLWNILVQCICLDTNAN